MSESKSPRGRIVVGVDGSDCSKAALRWGLQLAGISGSAIEAVIAWRYPFVGVVMPDWDPHAEALKVLQNTVEAVYGDQRPNDLWMRAVEGDPARVLIEASATETALVVGSRGHGGFAGLLLGSVSAQCVEHAACPVLVVHERRDRAEPSAAV